MKQKSVSYPKALKPQPITAVQHHPMVCLIKSNMAVGEKLLFFLASDIHLDNPKTKRELLKTHLDETVARGGYILLNGDTFCIMQGKYDPRSNKGALRPEHLGDDYMDRIIEDAVEFFTPYAKHIIYMGAGNHETSILKRSETNLLNRLSDRLFHETGHRILVGQYHGWIIIRGTIISANTKNTVSYKIYHNHGTGGDSAVTKGAIEHERKAAQVEGADAIWMGHNHHKYDMQNAVHYFDSNPKCDVPKIRIVEGIRTGTYKQEYLAGGWHIETGKAPKPLGGTWLELTMCRHTKRATAPFLAPTLTKSWHEPISL